MAQQHIIIGTPPAGLDGDTGRVAFEKTEANFNELFGASKGMIVGLRLERAAVNAIRVSAGAAHIESSNQLLALPADTTTSGALAANTWYHVYLFESAGAAAVELVTTAPGNPYSGTARSKSTDANRRFLGSAKTNAVGALYNFVHSVASGKVLYQENISPAPFSVVSGSATSPTTVSCAAVVPPSSKIAILTCNNNDPAVTVLLGNSDSPPQSSPFAFVDSCPASRTISSDFPLNAAQEFQYTFISAPSGNFVARVRGYTFER
ncbi:MAG TPA: hypothetical protein VD865_14755 [Stenotrophomonas sp.]|nr:hypothetical protein [Stenotrophomonas sp.]